MLEEGDIVMCMVERIVGTNIFVKTLSEGKEIEGSIVLSEIAPGRIRNLRDYVVPKKRIVCKVLRITPRGNIELSLRRVTQKERKEAIEKDKQEKGYISILKSILKERAETIISEITKKENLYSFINEAKENPKKLENLIGKEDTERILEIIKSQKQKKISIKKEISLTSTKPNGLELIKNVFEKVKNCEIRYLGSGRYSIKTESTDLKKADNMLREIFLQIDKVAKQKEMEFNIKEK